MEQGSCICSRCMTFSSGPGFRVKSVAGNGCMSWFVACYSVEKACLILTCVTILRSSVNLLAFVFLALFPQLMTCLFSVSPFTLAGSSFTALEVGQDCAAPTASFQLNVGVFQTTFGLNSCVFMSFCSISILHELLRCGSGDIFLRVPTRPTCQATRNNNNNNWQDLKRLCRT